MTGKIKVNIISNKSKVLWKFLLQKNYESNKNKSKNVGFTKSEDKKKFQTQEISNNLAHEQPKWNNKNFFITQASHVRKIWWGR